MQQEEKGGEGIVPLHLVNKSTWDHIVDSAPSGKFPQIKYMIPKMFDGTSHLNWYFFSEWVVAGGQKDKDGNVSEKERVVDPTTLDEKELKEWYDFFVEQYKKTKSLTSPTTIKNSSFSMQVTAIPQDVVHSVIRMHFFKHRSIGEKLHLFFCDQKGMPISYL